MSHSTLQLYGYGVDTSFDLLGNDENAITKSIGFSLNMCENFRTKFLAKFDLRTNKPIVIKLQEYQKGTGITDIEVFNEEIHLILEAKLDYEFPSFRQLNLYKDRIIAPKSCIVACSGLTRKYAEYHLSTILGTSSKIDGIPVRFISYDEIANITASSKPSSIFEKKLLHDLRLTLMKQRDLTLQSNMVFVKALGGGTDEWQTGTYIDVVDKHNVYFHDVGRSSYPKTPPNYFGFCWNGVLQCIRHVDSWKITQDLGNEKGLEFIDRKKWLKADKNPHVLYYLGPKLIPSHKVKASIRTTPYYLPIDIILTTNDIKKAKQEWEKRQQFEREMRS